MAYCSELGEARRIIKVGPKSYALVLPKKWLQEKGLGPGDNLILYINDDYIIIAPPSHHAREAASITLDRESIAKMALDEDTAVSCGYLMGFEGLTLKGFKFEDVAEKLSRYPWIEIEPTDGDERGISMRFVVKESSYDEKLLLKLMLREVLDLIGGITENALSAEALDVYIERAVFGLKKYGYLLARRLLGHAPRGLHGSSIIYFSAGLILGLLGELLLSLSYSLRKKGVSPEAGYMVSLMLSGIRDTIQEALSGLIYMSSKRCRRARWSYERFRRTLRILKYYSCPDIEVAEFIARLDSIFRVTGKLVEGCQCLVLSLAASKRV